MNQAHDITFWLAFLMIVCPVMDGIAAPMIQINASEDCANGNFLVMLVVTAVVLIVYCVSRKMRRSY